MRENSEEQIVVRKYFLGSLNDEVKMRQIEEQILLSNDFIEKLSIAEDDLIEEYWDANLTDDELKQFNQFFLNSPERKQKLQLIENLRKYAAQSDARTLKKPVQEKLPFFHWRSLYAPTALRFVVITLVLCSVGFGVWRISFYESDAAKGLAELRAAYRSERPFESRLSNFDYAPFSNIRGSNKSTAETVARDSAARKLLDAAQNEPDAKAFHALGNYYLTDKQFEKAVSQFDAALKLDSNNAQLYNDYGVALLENAKQVSIAEQPGKRLENLARAYEHFTRAVELNGSSLESLFNKAITLQQMNLPEQTKKAWRDYLEKDSSSPWADEARRNLQRLETQTSSAKTPAQVLTDFFEAFERRDEERAWQIVSQSREMISDTMVFFQLTRSFLTSEAANQTEQAEKYLVAMQFVGKMEKEKAGDPYFAELTKFYASSDQAPRRILLQAQNQMKTGYLLSQNSKYSEAITVFLQAKESFAKTGNLWESKLSEYWLSFLHDRSGKIEVSVQEFLALKNYCYEKKYKWLAVQILGWLAESALTQNEYSKALDYLNAALKITRENSDTYNQQKVLTRLGYYYSHLRELQKSLIQIEESLVTEQNYFSSDRQSWRSCLLAAETLYQFKLYNSAISFGQEALQIGSEKITESTANHASYYMLALLYGGLQRYSEALDFAQKSLLSIQSVKANDKGLLTNFSLLRTAHLHRQSGDYAESLKIYSTVIQEAAPQNLMRYELNNYEAHKGRLLCYFALNQTDLIEEELAVVLNLYEKFRSQILEEQTRNAFFDNEQSVYDLAVNFEYYRNNFSRAFETAEISKARSLLDLFQTKSSLEKNKKELTVRLNQAARPLSIEELQKRLPEQVQVVQYAVLSDKILIWVITRTQFSLVEKKITSTEISEQIEDYLKIIAESKLEQNASIEALQLYETLITPVLPLLDSNKEICIVPDKSLYRLPFAALVSPVNKHFLIEDFTVFSAPSATMLVLSSEAAAQKLVESEEKILSIGNPHFDKQEFPDLPDLPDAEKEAVKIAAYYQTAKTLTGNIADKQAVLSGLAESNIFHFAGHYAVNESSPMHSKLLLTRKKENQPADVEVHEILERNLHSVKLAVLSACRTGTENYYNGEGMIGIARSFLAGGVPLIIASQWAVDSDATAELMIKFHFHRKQHRLSSAKALRRAQLEMLNGSNQRLRSPYYWAGFLPIGGHTEY
ncbi:MAG: CHAT domain-containing protein [Acidobacteriota bacterium]|nr:CHAT domain-containing protein [Acidobacteriota bacterium]